jgi:colicin import membrane protein
MKPIAPDYKRALHFALALHVGLFIALIINIDFPWKKNKPVISYSVPNVEVIQAEMISQSTLDAQEKRDAEKQQAIAAEKQQQLDLARQEQLKREQEAAAKQLAEKKKQDALKIAEAEKKKQAEAERLAELEKKKQAELEKQKQAELEKQRQLAAQQAEAAKLEQAKQQQLQAEQQALAAAQQAQLQQAILSEVERFTLMVKQKVMQNWLVQRGYEGLSTELHVRVAPSGSVLDVQVVKRSGNEALDRSAVAAVQRASPLPVPTDPAVFASFREIRLILRPEDVLG